MCILSRGNNNFCICSTLPSRQARHLTESVNGTEKLSECSQQGVYLVMFLLAVDSQDRIRVEQETLCIAPHASFTYRNMERCFFLLACSGVCCCVLVYCYWSCLLVPFLDAIIHPFSFFSLPPPFFSFISIYTCFRLSLFSLHLYWNASLPALCFCKMGLVLCTAIIYGFILQTAAIWSQSGNKLELFEHIWMSGLCFSSCFVCMVLVTLRWSDWTVVLCF